MTIVDATIRHQRAAMIAADKATAKQLVDAYGQTWQAIRIDLATLTDQMQRALDAGDEVPVSWLYREQRLNAILNQVRYQVEHYGAFAQDTTAQAMRLAAQQAEADALAAMAVGMPAGISYTFNRLPVGAVNQLATSGRLDKLFRTFAPDAAKKAKQSIIAGVAAGYSPNQMAQELRDALGTPLYRALTIARTETMNAYRESSIATYRENSDVVEEWEWVAGIGCCEFCADQNESRHPLGEEMNSHPRCRCSASPITRSWASILGGFVGGMDEGTVSEGVDVFE